MQRKLRRRQFLLKAGLGALALTGLGTSARLLSHNHFAMATNADDLIDPEITGHERDVMLALLAKLQPDHRQEVVYVDSDCRVFVNRVSLRREISFMRHVRQNIYLTSRGEEVAFPEAELLEADQFDASAITVCQDKQAGPYRRLRSKQGTSSVPYTYISAKVYLPSRIKGEIKTGQGETAYIYSGGKDSTDPPDNVDAGMQHNKDKDDWTVYTKPAASFCNPVEVIRFQAGQYVTLEFFVPFDDQVAIHAAGLNENGVLKCRTCSINRFGLKWNDSGIGIHLKRVTSIAQPVKYTPGTGVTCPPKTEPV